MPTPASVDLLIRRWGRPATLRRTRVTGGPVDVTVIAVVVSGPPVSLDTGERMQTEIVAHITVSEIAAAGWPGPPKMMDRLITQPDQRTYSLTGDGDPIYILSDLAAYQLRMRG